VVAVNVQAWADGGNSADQLISASASECERLLPSHSDLRWSDMHSRLRNCALFMCELLRHLTASHLSTAAAISPFSFTIGLLADTACKFAEADDVSQQQHAVYNSLASTPPGMPGTHLPNILVGGTTTGISPNIIAYFQI